MEYKNNKFYSYGNASLGMKGIIKPSKAAYLGFSSKKMPFDQNKYLYSHVTVVGGSVLDSNNFHIKSGYEGLVNSHGDTIPTQILGSGTQFVGEGKFPGNPDGFNFLDTFRESFNFFEHIHLPEFVKGYVVDYFPYVQNIGNVPVLMVDALLATELKHKDLIGMILDGTVACVSQGCSSTVLTCSRCGKKFHAIDDICEHLEHQNNEFFRGPDQDLKIVGNILGDPEDKESFEFFDISWVYKGAYFIAILQKVLNKNLDSIKKKTVQDAFLGLSDNINPMFSGLGLNYNTDYLLEQFAASNGKEFRHFAEDFIKDDREKFAASMVDLSKYYYFMSTLNDVIRGGSMDRKTKAKLSLMSAKRILGTSSSSDKLVSLAKDLLKKDEKEFLGLTTQLGVDSLSVDTKEEPEAVADITAPKVKAIDESKGIGDVKGTKGLPEATIKGGELTASATPKIQLKVLSADDKEFGPDSSDQEVPIITLKDYSEPKNPPMNTNLPEPKVPSVSSIRRAFKASVTFDLDFAKYASLSAGAKIFAPTGKGTFSSAVILSTEGDFCDVRILSGDLEGKEVRGLSLSELSLSPVELEAVATVAPEPAVVEATETVESTETSESAEIVESADGDGADPAPVSEEVSSPEVGMPDSGAVVPEEQVDPEVDLNLDATSESISEAVALLQEYLKENAAVPENPTDDELSNALQAVESKFGPEVIAAVLVDYEESGEPAGDAVDVEPEVYEDSLFAIAQDLNDVNL